MSIDAVPQRASEPESYEQLISITGAGAGTPVKNYGKGVAITWVSTGRYRLTFTDHPGNFITLGGPSWQDATPANLKQFSAVTNGPDATGKIFDLFVYNGSGNLTDLTSTNTLSCAMVFKRAGVTT